MLFSVKIKPEGKRDFVTQVGDARLSVEVKTKAKDNQANERMIELIAKHFSLSVKQVKLVRGHHRPQKIVNVDIK